MINKIGQGFYQLGHVTVRFSSGLYTALLQMLLRTNFNFTAFVGVDIPSKELLIRKYSQENLCDHIIDVI